MRTPWKSVHKGIVGILINIGIRSPSGERFGLLYGVTLRGESVGVLGTSTMGFHLWRELRRIYSQGHFWEG